MYTNAITKEVIPLNQISGGFTVPYHKQGIVTASGLMRKNQHTIATLSLSQLWATLPIDLKELLYDSNELVNYDDIMSFYKNHHTHHTLSSQSYAPENSILLANYYEHHMNTEDPRNLIIVTNLIYNVIFLTFANLTHDENNNQVTFTSAIDHFYKRGKIHGENQIKAKGVLKLIDTKLGPMLETNDDEKTKEAKEGLFNELVFQKDFSRLLDMYRLVERTQKELLTARTMSINTEEEESTTIDYQDDNDSKSELNENESTITINMPTLSLASSILTTAAVTTPTVVEPKPTVQFTKKITQGNVGSIHWTGEWYGSTLLLATDLTKQTQNTNKSSITMKVMTHATSTVLIFIFLLFYIKKSRQLLIMHELKQQKRSSKKKSKENWRVCFAS